ncbi:serine/threonine-protein kinase pim-1-like [Platichthys flesus]|uniref:serine/threonine-protein kinase pim-1-like n=1 Tax=Platichthys flesus TaxID=8260 RepID=UPI002DB85578|nr:serine/threonine-protein kinase pim-1-like [Platichthys flesus]
MTSNLREMDSGETPHTLQAEIKASPEADGPDRKVSRVKGRKRKVRENDDGRAGKTKREAGHESASCSVDVASTKAEVRGRRKITSGGRRGKRRTRVPGDRQRAKFVNKYWQLDQIGSGGFGSVYAGFRKADWLPVAIKHVEDRMLPKPVCLNGKELPKEVAIMMKLAAEKNDSAGMSAPIELLEWYDLGNELILVLERSFDSKDLHDYIVEHGPVPEWKAKLLMKQLVDAAIGLEKRQIFHRDIKLENILIDEGSSVPGVRLIDFGVSEIAEKDTIFTINCGTEEHQPPECYFQSCHSPGPTTVWQLGIVLFEMLLREAFSTEDYLQRKLNMSSKLSEECRDFLRACWRKEPALRSTLTELQLHPWLR